MYFMIGMKTLFWERLVGLPKGSPAPNGVRSPVSAGEKQHKDISPHLVSPPSASTDQRAGRCVFREFLFQLDCYVTKSAVQICPMWQTPCKELPPPHSLLLFLFWKSNVTRSSLESPLWWSSFSKSLMWHSGPNTTDPASCHWPPIRCPLHSQAACLLPGHWIHPPPICLQL